MNPAQIRRLARRIHEDRSRRIETLLVRLAADGTLYPSPTSEDVCQCQCWTVHPGETGICSNPPTTMRTGRATCEACALRGDLGPGDHKVLTRNYVWCDAHCEVHGAKPNFYDDGTEFCEHENWRSVYVQSDDPNEEF